jgi:peroxiredoxin Q/BCP
MTWILIVAAAIAALVVWRNAAIRGRAPKAGDPAPAFSLRGHDGRLRELAEFRGRWLVLYFFPRAETPVCTEQAARFAAAMRDIEARGAVVCGVSVDGEERLARFVARYQLPFALLSDPGGAVAARYGSLVDLGVFRFARRNTFLVDPRGNIAKIYLNVNPARNTADVVADIEEANRP